MEGKARRIHSGAFSNANGLSFGVSAGHITGSYSVPSTAGLLSNIKISAGLSSANLSAITFSNSNGLAFGLSGSVITGSYTVPGGGASPNFSAGTTNSNLDSVVFADSKGVQFGLSGSTITASVKTDYVGLNTALTANGVSWTVNTSGVSLNVPAFLTTARRSTDAVGLNTAQTNVTWTVNSSGLSLDAGGYAGTNGAITGGSITVNTGGVSVNLPAYLTNIVVRASGNTVSGSVISFSNANRFTFGVGLAGGVPAVTASGDFAGTGTSATNASITLNSNGLAISVAAPGGGAGFTKSRFNPFMEAVAAEGQMGQGTLHFHPVPDPDNFCFDRVYFDVRGTEGTQTNSTGSYTISMWAGLYTRNASTLSLLASSSTTLGLTKSGTQRASVNNGPRVMTMGWTSTITQDDLWCGIVSSTASAGQNLYTLSQYMASDVNSNFSGILGAASAATAQNVLGLGVYTAATAGLPASVAFSQINGSASQFLRVPLYYFVNGTA
jgi:hypothetical protein